MNTLNRLTCARSYKITEYVNWKRLTVKYWLEYAAKVQQDFKFSIVVGEASDYLQTAHQPTLDWREHKRVDAIFRGDELLVEMLVHQIVRTRSTKRLATLRAAFAALSFCHVRLDEAKPALHVTFNNNNNNDNNNRPSVSESLWILIDFYSGLFQVLVPHSLSQLTAASGGVGVGVGGGGTSLKQSLEACINGDLKQLASVLMRVRVSLLLKRCESLAQCRGFRCTDQLAILYYVNDETHDLYAKLDKARLFVELKRHENVYIVGVFASLSLSHSLTHSLISQLDISKKN